MMSNMFVLSEKSLKNLNGVHADLVRVVKTAITITLIDFTIGEGLRTLERQKQLYKTGATHTLNGRHLTGHAVDLIALVDKKERWDWPLYYKIAEAMRLAAKQERVKIEWGGVWDKTMDQYDDVEKEALRYIQRCKIRGKKAFTDGPHFQLAWIDYPKK